MGSVCRCRTEIQRKHCSVLMVTLFSYAGVLKTLNVRYNCLILLPRPGMNEPDGNPIASCHASAILVGGLLNPWGEGHGPEARRPKSVRTHHALVGLPLSTSIDIGLNPSRLRGWQVRDDQPNPTQPMSTAPIAVLSSLACGKMEVGS